MNYYIIVTIAIITSFINPLFSQSLPEGFEKKAILTNQLNPTSIKFTPDNKLLIGYKGGVIKLVENGILRETPFFNINVWDYWERGMQGFAFDPNYLENGYFYVYYAYSQKEINRLSRFKVTNDVADISSEFVIFESDTLTSGMHNGGSVFFQGDGKLYLSLGEDGHPQDAQNLNSVHGKILRFNTDGTIPEDNPFYNSTTGRCKAIYAYGLRNPFKVVHNAKLNKTYINDVGESTWEEINELKKGANYGWPVTEGKIKSEQTAPSDYIDPIYIYDHIIGCAITGGNFYTPDKISFPLEYNNKYFFTDYCNGWIRSLNSSTGTASDFGQGFGLLTDILPDNEGNLMILAIENPGNENNKGGILWKVSYTGAKDVSISNTLEDKTGAEGSSLNFEVIANGEGPLNYRWQINGVDIENANSSKLNLGPLTSDNNNFTLRAIVANSYSSDTTNSVIVTVLKNHVPVPVIEIPEGDKDIYYKAGDIVTFSGKATDLEDGELSQQALSWKIDFHHDDHTHPGMPSTSGISMGSFEIPTVGETSANVWYRIYLTATDSEGFSATTYKEIFPEISTVTLRTDPPGLNLTLDGTVVNTPYSFEGVVGINRVIGTVHTQTLSNKNYVFSTWSNNGSESQSISTPSTDQEYIANFSILTHTEQPEEVNSINLLPNPVEDKLIVTWNKNLKGSRIRVVDQLGRELLVDKCTNESSLELNTEKLPNGHYLFYLETDNSRIVKHFIVAK